MLSGGSMVTQDIVPYAIAQGDRAKIVGLNFIGLKRRGFSDQALSSLKAAYKLVFRSDLRLGAAITRIEEELEDGPELQVLVDFLKRGERGIAR